MSSLAVREYLGTTWASLLPTLPLKDANNRMDDYRAGLPNEWAALLYPGASDNRISMGRDVSCWREDGIVTMRVFVKAGTGNIRALQIATAVKAAWENHVGLSGYFRIKTITPPVDLSSEGESSGDWYSVQVEAVYSHETYK